MDLDTLIKNKKQEITKDVFWVNVNKYKCKSKHRQFTQYSIIKCECMRVVSHRSHKHISNQIKWLQFHTKLSLEISRQPQPSSWWSQHEPFSNLWRLAYLWSQPGIYILMFILCQIFLFDFKVIIVKFCQINHHFNVISYLTLSTLSQTHIHD